MSRASMSTGNITFNSNTETSTPTTKPRDNDQAFHILITGDFTGRQSRGEFEPGTLATRKIIEIDRDNFEDVFSQLDVQLKLPISDIPIKFEEFDELHPDVLVERLDVFEKFQVLKRRLKKPELFDAAVAEIQSWNPESMLQEETPNEEESGIPLPDNMLDAIFSQASFTNTSAGKSAANDIDKLIQSIVAPYAQSKEDPRLPEMLEAVDEATAQTLRKIMHASDFQSLEANWRGLYFLVRRLETDSKLKLFIMDVSRDELIDDVINHNDFNDTALFKRLVGDYQVAGAVPFSVIQCNVSIEDDIDDLQLAASLANIAQEHSGIALAAGSEKLAGCESIALSDEVATWQYDINSDFQPAWEAFREDELSQYIALAAPRFMLRLPYGKHTSPIEAFDFEELPEYLGHEYYLWGNSAHLVTLVLAETAQRNGGEVPPNTAAQIDGLPLHVYKEDGESAVKACAEVFIRDSEVGKFADAGLLSVRSIKDRDAVLVPVLRTVSKQGVKIFERSSS